MIHLKDAKQSIAYSYSEPTLLFRDSGNSDIDVLVRSGDYLIALASRLDAISETLQNTTGRIDLENCIRELMYISKKYKLEVARESYEAADN